MCRPLGSFRVQGSLDWGTGHAISPHLAPVDLCQQTLPSIRTHKSEIAAKSLEWMNELVEVDILVPLEVPEV